jgi:hypothetical protein
MTTTVQEPTKKEDHLVIRERAVAAAGNIGAGDIAAGLIVIQNDGTIRVTPFNLGVAGVMQLMAQGISMLAGKMRVGEQAPPKWIPCGPEGSTCELPGRVIVRYGADGKYFTKVAEGSIVCSNDVFGDPAPGVVKSCSYRFIAPPTV